MAALMPEGKQSFNNSAGAPLVGGKLYTYDAGTNTPRPTYQDSAGLVPNTNPVVLDARGEATVFWVGSYKVVLRDASDATIWTVDNIVSTESLVAALTTLLSLQTGSSIVGYIQGSAGSVPTTVQSKLRETVSVKDFGALGAGADESAAAIAMIAATNRLYIPPGFTLVAKNISLNNDTEVVSDGILKLPNACSDFDRLLIGVSKSDIRIRCKELDGNYAGQGANIGTHLVYLTNCPDAIVDLKFVHDHYVSSGAPTPSVDGIRNASTGTVFLYRCTRAVVDISLLEGWGREAIYLLDCTHSEVTVGHCQGKYLTEYSGVQVSGRHNTVHRASVDFAGASAVGFDTAYGSLSNIISTNTRENSGVNFGHTGYPATGSVASNLVVDSCFGIGISVLSATQDLNISNFSVQNTGDAGIQFSDNSGLGKLNNGAVSYPLQWNLVAGAVAEITATNVKSSVRDAQTMLVAMSSGLFVDGETVTTATGSAVARKALRNLTVSQQKLFFTSVTGTFSAAQAITGSTSGATGVVSAVYTPSEYNEAAGGVYIRDPRYFPGTGDQIRFPDGTALYTRNLACVYTGSGSVQTFVQTFFGNVVWASAPTVVLTVSSHNTTGAFVINYLEGNATSAAASVILSATVNQTYGVTIMAIGRWK